MQRIKNPKFNRNPKGRGGFGTHPEHQSPGGWNKNNSIVYWMHYFLALTVAKFRKFEDDIPENMRSIAASLAYARVHASRSNLRECVEVTNRTEGYPRQSAEYFDDGQREFSGWSEEELDNEFTNFFMTQYEYGYLKVYDTQNHEVKISRIEFQSLTKEQMEKRNRPNIVPTQMIG